MRLAPALLAALVAVAARAEDFRFDASEFEKKPLEVSGYLELKPERAWLNPDGTLYKLAGLDRDTLDRTTGTLKLNGKYTKGPASVVLHGSVESRTDDLGSKRSYRFDEAYASYKPDPGFTLDLGKVALKWGKGYAWNPVGFVERPKDPNDVELAREGYSVVTADLIRNFDGDLKTVAFTPVVLPVGNEVNGDFGKPNYLNPAAKLYLLYLDTDIDFTWLGGGSRTPRFGADFSRNVNTALEIHGEWARFLNYEKRTIDSAGRVASETADVTSYLLGLRYLTESDTTWIAEYYRNGTGYSREELAAFSGLVDSGNGSLFARAQQAGSLYSRPYIGQRYFYLKASQKEPFDIVYFTPSITAIVNVGDNSWTLTPELLYTAFTNLDLRLRVMFLHGGKGSEFGEKQNERRLELMARLYF